MLDRNLYMIRNAYTLSMSNGLSIYELHRRLGHISYDYLKRLLKTNPTILKQQITNFDEKQCVECIKANIEQAPIPKIRMSEQSANFGDIIHIDIVGPIHPLGYQQTKYMLTIVDDAT